MLRDEKKLWELQVDHSLFAIEKLDVTVTEIPAVFPFSHSCKNSCVRRPKYEASIALSVI